MEVDIADFLERFDESDRTFVSAEDEPRGKRAACVAGIIRLLLAAEGRQVPYDVLLDEVEMGDQPAQMRPAMDALEMVGVVHRWTYVESGKVRSRIAYSIDPDLVELVD